MATITVRGLDEEVRRQIKLRAAEDDRSMEAEVRQTLTESYAPHNLGMALLELGDWVRSEFGGVDLPIPPRSMPREIDFS